MSRENGTVVYTQQEKDFIQKMLKNIPEAQKYWEENPEIWGNNISFLIELYPFVSLVGDALCDDNFVVVQQVLDMIEEFLSGSGKESFLDITYFFFETLTNTLGWKDKEYMETMNNIEDKDEKYTKKLVNMLGERSKECCKEVDRFWGTKMPGLYEEDDDK
ncbi:conserved hypothetical protein [Alphaproteobacteria bacterium]